MVSSVGSCADCGYSVVQLLLTSRFLRAKAASACRREFAGVLPDCGLRSRPDVESATAGQLVGLFHPCSGLDRGRRSFWKKTPVRKAEAALPRTGTPLLAGALEVLEMGSGNRV